ncbi:P-loop containing nucleoside triphosphate hydrolase protein [Ephemerocybe angulata]|uniref:P-loop containing nucleoside triphosphate hydrolase protein n=1 Tax=Ephemerocybe angulata TaxID=980116 RepID=A0A8H6I330_9AGAR|nr:P-loop containing nucleoside triphosphate hydrolase protein [Tulosesus angulatus]
MRRPTTLAVDTSATTNTGLNYELEVSPRNSIDTQVSTIANDLKKPVDAPSIATATPPQPASPPVNPSIRLLFSLLSRRHFFFLLLPAILSSLVSGGIAPFMTFVIGQAFDAFAKFPLTPNPPQAAKDALLRAVGLSALELVGLAVGSLALGSVTSCLWIWTGEVNVGELRRKVYLGVMSKEMGWFDTRMGSSEGSEVQVASSEDSEGPVGAGGLMAKFTRVIDTDDVRNACSLASGLIVQHLTTTIASLILAFIRSWALTLVVLSAVPLLMVIQAVSRSLASPLLFGERHSISVSATVIERCLTAMSTVKAFNAQNFEQARADKSFNTLKTKGTKLVRVWGFSSGVAQFVMMGMFVQGFWFGAKLVREGRISPGDVMAVFWACLIATSNLQMCIPHSITLQKGKFAMASLITLATDSMPPPNSQPAQPASPDGNGPVTPTAAVASRKPFRNLRKITPARCYGELALHNVGFAYPTRPTLPVLQDVSLYLPARETTFIVGSSGSGKSTVAQLLLRMYDATDSGYVTLDEQDVLYLDENWVRSKIMGVTQSTCVLLEGKAVFENIACAVPDRVVSREEVEEACRAALIHDFVRDLPEGYDTLLGGSGGGVSLSGGQRQRLAFARARLRNPEVLILDEATSALDATSRILVFAALRQWRKNKTTIVITHDLSQIEDEDFVYVLKKGKVVEQGYRSDLQAEVDEFDIVDEEAGKGEFRKMMESQRLTGGFLPEKDVNVDEEQYRQELQEALHEVEEEQGEKKKTSKRDTAKYQSLLRPLTMGNWMFDVVADLVAPPTPAALHNPTDSRPVSRFGNPTFQQQDPYATTKQRPMSVIMASPTSPTRRPLSLQFTPTSTTFTLPSTYGPMSTYAPTYATQTPKEEAFEDEDNFEDEKDAIKRSGTMAKNGRTRRERRPTVTIAVDEKKTESSSRRRAATTTLEDPEKKEDVEVEEQRHAFWATMRAVWPTVPHRPVLLLGLVVSVLSGAMTPVFSYLLSRLLFEVSIGAKNVKIVNQFGGIVLGVAAADGTLLGLKYFLMEYCGLAWVTKLRSEGLANLLKQDTKFFDKRPENSPSKLVQILVKDAEDARNLVAVVWCQFLVVATMLSVGLIWAMVRGWQLTLVGLAIAPVFAGVMTLQTTLVSKCEVRNKRAREDVAKGYYDAIINVRGIRAMAFEKLFWDDFDAATNKALTTGVRGAFVEGCTYGVASGLIYLAEALLFYVGAVLISKGTYTYLQMVEVLNLVVFTVTIGSQLMAFTERIAKSVQATGDLHRISNLDTSSTDESRGLLKPPVSGALTFHDVFFAYPERPEAPVLRGVDVQIREGECVAIVGSSGSGKSTMAALLQRLYEPTAGAIFVGDTQLRDMDVKHLRDNISVVSQHPNLFDASIYDNIRYGQEGLSDADVQQAAKAARVHDFITSLPEGYDTVIGENASLISGGQAQRLQIARALARPSKILILDECTSALDPENQAAVMETIREVKKGRTTVMVTHKMQVMLMCDRILVVGEGEVREEGTYEELMRRNGVFAALASGGEWNGE